MSHTVSILCPTYARTDLLAELVECFVRQDATDCRRELVILNDYAPQQLRCDVPGVRIVNHDVRFRTLGAKRSALLDLADGDLIQWWDDDDLFLPHHLSSSLAKVALGEALRPVPGPDDPPAPAVAVARLPYEYRYDGVDLTLQAAGGMRGYTWDRTALRSLFPMTEHRGEWSRLVHRAVAVGWLHGPHHDRPTCAPSVIQRVTGHHRVTTHSPEELTSNAEHRVAAGAEPLDEVLITPRWNQDYLALVRNSGRPTTLPSQTAEP